MTPEWHADRVCKLAGIGVVCDGPATTAFVLVHQDHRMYESWYCRAHGRVCADLIEEWKDSYVTWRGASALNPVAV